MDYTRKDWETEARVCFAYVPWEELWWENRGQHLDQMERAKVGETTIRIGERNGEKPVGKDSRGVILVKEKGKTRSHIFTYATGLPSLRLFLTRLFAISATKGKSRFSPGSPVLTKRKSPHIIAYSIYNRKSVR